MNQTGKAEGEALVVYPDHLTVLAAWFEDGKMVSGPSYCWDYFNATKLNQTQPKTGLRMEKW